jgi:putative restriction endonuclease
MNCHFEFSSHSNALLKMNFYLGVTDPRWFNYLRQSSHEDVNFWRPGDVAFRAIPQGGPFVFKLKGRINKIVGLGFFYQYIKLPINVAWETFGPGNGFLFLNEFIMAINDLRGKREHNPELGCIVLTNPIFFKEEDWIEVPPNWKSNIVSGSTYSTESEIGRDLWSEIEARLHKYLNADLEPGKSLSAIGNGDTPEYNWIMSKVRIGQGSFRASVTNAYAKRCSITGERTLPVLEAAHIKSYAKSGPHLASNGLLLRSDLHKLFDNGYITITKRLKVEVSSRIRSEFENGKEYYQFHGKDLAVMPSDLKERPGERYLQWHNDSVYKS